LGDGRRGEEGMQEGGRVTGRNGEKGRRGMREEGK